jgi:hypothetical protein
MKSLHIHTPKGSTFSLATPRMSHEHVDSTCTLAPVFEGVKAHREYQFMDTRINTPTLHHVGARSASIFSRRDNIVSVELGDFHQRWWLITDWWVMTEGWWLMTGEGFMTDDWRMIYDWWLVNDLWLMTDDWWLMTTDWGLITDDWWLMTDDWCLVTDDWCYWVMTMTGDWLMTSDW